MEYTITSSKWNGENNEEFTESFSGTPKEIAELLKLTNGMGEESDNVKKSLFKDIKNALNKKEIRAKDLIESSIAIHCETKELAMEFLQKLQTKEVYVPFARVLYNELLNSSSFNPNTCYWVESDGNFKKEDLEDLYIAANFHIIKFKKGMKVV